MSGETSLYQTVVRSITVNTKEIISTIQRLSPTEVLYIETSLFIIGYLYLMYLFRKNKVIKNKKKKNKSKMEKTTLAHKNLNETFVNEKTPAKTYYCKEIIDEKRPRLTESCEREMINRDILLPGNCNNRSFSPQNCTGYNIPKHYNFRPTTLKRRANNTFQRRLVSPQITRKSYVNRNIQNNPNVLHLNYHPGICMNCKYYSKCIHTKCHKKFPDCKECYNRACMHCRIK
jgi:hypothetical protein